jgi:prepilin-type N-terminal cleavage/methylation domain-containing protein
MATKSKKRGFSLGEILVAIAIVAVIAAVVIPSVGSQLKTGDESRVQEDLVHLRGAAEQFLADVRRYPLTIGQLVRRPTATANNGSLDGTVYTTPQINRWRGPYLSKDSVSAHLSGFDAQINYVFTNEVHTPSSQNYLVITIPTFDTVMATNIDQRMDDGAKSTGQIIWVAAASPTTTLKYFAIPIQ